MCLTVYVPCFYAWFTTSWPYIKFVQGGPKNWDRRKQTVPVFWPTSRNFTQGMMLQTRKHYAVRKICTRWAKGWDI